MRSGSAAAHGARILHYDLRSRFTHRTLTQTAAIPAGVTAGERRPLLVFLHGRGEHGNDSNSNADFYAVLARLGDRAPAVVFPDGGTDSYWHKRRSGDWGRYVLEGRRPWGEASLWLDGGDGDPFKAGTDAFAAALGITAHHSKGAHDGDYWHAHYARYLRFYASALAGC